MGRSTNYGSLLATSRQHVTVSVNALRTGVRIQAPIREDNDDREVLLLAAGSILTPHILQRLKERGVQQVRIHPSDVLRLTGRTSVAPQPKPVEPPAERQAGSTWAVTSESFVHKIARHGAAPYQVDAVALYETAFNDSVATMDRLVEGLTAGTLHEAPELTDVSADALSKIAADMDLFLALGLAPGSAAYPGRHSTQTAMTAIAIGTMLGLRRDNLIELGVGCLIHDTGMQRLKIPVFETQRALTPLEFLEVTKHPAITYDLLKELRDVPTGARMVAYQMHERCNGSGYPRGRQGNQIHPLARIAAVADVFVALASPRPWRPPMAPYKAMETIIRDTQKGLFDPQVVRALLHAVSLFPIGSFVETSDGRVGRVVRANRERYTMPVVELWRPDQGQPPELVDLSSTASVAITRSLAALPPEPQRVQAALDYWE